MARQTVEWPQLWRIHFSSRSDSLVDAVLQIVIHSS